MVYLDDYDPSDPDQAVITFDGIYEDVFHYARPILKHFGYPYELFIVGDTVGRDNAFDQHVEPPAMFAGAEQLKLLVNDGGRLQWHSRSHIDLTRPENRDQTEHELAIPDKLRKLDPNGFKWFGYPHGRHDDELINHTRQKYSGALSCEAGNDHDPYQLNRIIVKNDTSFSRSTVSLIIANYNYGGYAAEAIESVLRQSIKPDEILFMDDCSVDNSLEVARRYEDQIQIVSNEQNLGIVDNFNKAVSLTTGDYICFLGADNRFRSDYVARCKQALDTNPKAAIAYTNAVLFGPRAEVVAQLAKANPVPDNPGLYYWDFPEWDRALVAHLQKSNFIHGSSMYRRIVFDEIGGYRKTDGPEDHNLFARMTSAGWDAVLVPEYLLEYRQHSNEQANTALNTEMEVAYYRRALKKQNDQIAQLQQTATGPLAKAGSLDKGLTLLEQAIDAGNISSGMELAEKILGQYPEHATLLHRYGQLLAQQNELEAARSSLQMALRYNPTLAAAHNDLGIILFELEKADEAAHHLREASRLDPENQLYVENIADLELSKGDVDKALQLYEEALQLNPANKDLLFKLAQILTELARPSDARALCSKVLELDPAHQQAQNLYNQIA